MAFTWHGGHVSVDVFLTFCPFLALAKVRWQVTCSCFCSLVLWNHCYTYPLQEIYLQQYLTYRLSQKVFCQSSAIPYCN